MLRIRTAVAVLLPALWAMPATAGEDAKDPEPKVRRGAEIVMHIDRPERERSWIRANLERVHLGKRGLHYRRSLRLDSRPLELRVMAPGLKRNRYGLEIELRF